VPQAIRDVSASYDALVDLFESIESFLGRLEIYTRIPPSAALMDIVAKIIVELFFTLALATKQVKLGRFSEFIVLADAVLDSTQRREICKKASERE
jgi:hypothetical protein